MTDAAKRLTEDAAFANVSGLDDATDRQAHGSPARSRLEMMLASGSDEPSGTTPGTRRDPYGALASPAPDELWFSSAAASAITERSYAAAHAAVEALAQEGANLGDWFDRIRARIVAQFGAPGVEVVLTGSAMEAERVALTVAKALLGRPIVNIVVAPDETGGVSLASAGRERDDVIMRRVDIRDASGRPRAAAEIDRAAGLAVADALRIGRAALLRLLDSSETGRGGPSRAAAREILASAGERAVVLVDASQLRCSYDQIRADLDAGCLVTISGSKFAGGPPFCGALLIPADKAARLCKMTPPGGLPAYAPPASLGAGLRWTAALAEIEAYAGAPARLREEIAALFAESARRCVAGNPDLDFLDAECWRLGGKPATVFPILTHRGDPAQARLIYEALRASTGAFDSPALSRPCHVGPPVVVGGRAALRLCFSMPQANAVAERVAQGLDADAAFLPLRRDMELLFRKWAALAKRIGVNGGLTLAASNS